MLLIVRLSRYFFLISASTNEGACYACPLGTYCNPDPTPCPFDNFCPVDKTYAPTFVGAFEKASCYVKQALKKLKTFQLKHGMVIIEEEITASQDCRFFCIQEIFLKILMPKIYFFNPSNFGNAAGKSRERTDVPFKVLSLILSRRQLQFF